MRDGLGDQWVVMQGGELEMREGGSSGIRTGCGYLLAIGSE